MYLDVIEQGQVVPLGQAVQAQGDKRLVSDREHGQSYFSMDPAIHKDDEKSVDGKKQGVSLGPVLHVLGGGDDNNDIPDYDKELPGIDSLCLECVTIPCVCVLTVLTGRLDLLKGHRDKDRKTEHQDVPDRKEESKEEVPDGRRTNRTFDNQEGSKPSTRESGRINSGRKT